MNSDEELIVRAGGGLKSDTFLQRFHSIICKTTILYCVVFVSMLTITVTVGCQEQSSLYFGTVEPRHGPRELWINNSSEPEWLDPGRCSDSTGGEIIWNTFEGLVQAHP
ncbi:MAG: hypothetical protein KAT44_06330, partial [Pirellulales bacterium]|nr:hypothetical protein [Pirellulales bacterium]